MVRMYAKLHKSMEILEYFTTRSWEWTHGHLDMLKSQMTPEDQKVRIGDDIYMFKMYEVCLFAFLCLFGLLLCVKLPSVCLCRTQHNSGDS